MFAKTSSLTALLTACALLWAGVVCACPPSVESPPMDAGHQHHAMDDSPSSLLCAHADCDDGDRVQGDCHTAGPLLTSMDRDGRAATTTSADSGDGDPALLDSGSDPPRHARPVVARSLSATPPPWRASTPVQRKDQLTE